MNRTALACTTIATIGLVGAALLTAGPLNPPPGAPTSTYKTLQEVEPRTAINATNTPPSPAGTFTITQPGSYYLTSNILADPGRPFAIAITAPRVTIDLNGFNIDANTVGGIGINGGNTTAPLIQHNITIRNGSINNFSTFGIVNFLAPQGFPDAITPAIHIDSVRLTGRSDGNPGTGQGTGVRVGRDAIIRNTTVNYTVIGIHTGFNANVIDCSVFAAASGAYLIGDSSTVTNCVAVGTFSSPGAPVPGAGFYVGKGSLVTRSLARTNQTIGFVLENACSLIDSSATDNTTAGIETRGNALVSRATVAGGAVGIRLTSGGNRLENSKVGNATNAITSTGIDTIVDNTLNSAAVLTGIGIELNGADSVAEGNTLYSFNVGISIPGGFMIVTRNRFNNVGSSISGPGAAGSGVAPVLNSIAGTPNPFANIRQ